MRSSPTRAITNIEGYFFFGNFALQRLFKAPLIPLGVEVSKKLWHKPAVIRNEEIRPFENYLFPEMRFFVELHEPLFPLKLLPPESMHTILPENKTHWENVF